MKTFTDARQRPHGAIGNHVMKRNSSPRVHVPWPHNRRFSEPVPSYRVHPAKIRFTVSLSADKRSSGRRI